MSRFPVDVEISGDGRHLFVTSLWTRQVTIMRVTSGDGEDIGLEVVSRIDLPFSPRRQLALPGESRLLVADAFAGKVAVIDYQSQRIESVRSVNGQNIRSLSLSPDGEHVLLAQQVLNPACADDTRQYHLERADGEQPASSSPGSDS